MLPRNVIRTFRADVSNDNTDDPATSGSGFATLAG
jgi:hypothetical protein